MSDPHKVYRTLEALSLKLTAIQLCLDIEICAMQSWHKIRHHSRIPAASFLCHQRKLQLFFGETGSQRKQK